LRHRGKGRRSGEKRDVGKRKGLTQKKSIREGEDPKIEKKKISGRFLLLRGSRLFHRKKELGPDNQDEAMPEKRDTTKRSSGGEEI